MGAEQNHPITTPKGATAFAVVLAVISVFMPFFAGIETALVVAALAICMILWIYSQEAISAIRQRSGYWGLGVPFGLICAIVCVAGAAEWKIQNQVAPPAALTLADISTTVDSALKRERPVELPATIPAHIAPPKTTYRIIMPPAEHLAPELPNNVHTTPNAEKRNSVFDEAVKSTNRFRAEMDAKMECSLKNTKLVYGLNSLQNKSVDPENAYYYGKNDKKMAIIYLANTLEFMPSETCSAKSNIVKTAINVRLRKCLRIIQRQRFAPPRRARPISILAKLPDAMIAV